MLSSAGNSQPGHDGRFEGAYRVNVEDVPRRPAFPAAWTLSDPRGRPYFVFWTSPFKNRTLQALPGGNELRDFKSFEEVCQWLSRSAFGPTARISW
jgi:hypothetical protein